MEAHRRQALDRASRAHALTEAVLILDQPSLYKDATEAKLGKFAKEMVERKALQLLDDALGEMKNAIKAERDLQAQTVTPSRVEVVTETRAKPQYIE